MTTLVRTLMFVACMLYGSMPAQSAIIMSGQINLPDAPARQTEHVTQDHTDHSGKSMARDHAAMKMPEGAEPCPHRGDMKHVPFCAACVIVLPETLFISDGMVMTSYPAPQLGVEFLAEILTPPLPPPRA